MVTMGGNNLVDGGSTFLSGAANIYNAFTNQEPVDYSYNPAHEAVDAFVPEGAWNTTAHVAYDILDLVGGGVGIGKGLSVLKTERGGIRLLDKNKKFKDTFVFNATNEVGKINKDITFTMNAIKLNPATKGYGSSPRFQFGYDGNKGWHLGIGTANGKKGWERNAGIVLGAATVIKSIYSYFNYSSNSDAIDNK